MRGKAPYHIEFRWIYGPPIPVGLDPDARATLIAQRLDEILERSGQPSRNERASRPDSAEITQRPS